MVDLFRFQYAENVRIVDIDGVVFVGTVIDIIDREDTASGESDEITVNINGEYIGFSAEEISSIENA